MYFHIPIIRGINEYSKLSTEWNVQLNLQDCKYAIHIKHNQYVLSVASSTLNIYYKQWCTDCINHGYCGGFS